uniref:Rabankyrin-5-like n=1 Tax=Actinia tenebrosa TaxID=6105 RepID=A0A6P8I0Z8_ACTTE
MADEGQVAKLERHLSLLREEYVKLQNKMIDIEQKYSVAIASSGQVNENTFVSRLLKTVAELYDKDLYSDITVSFDGQKVKAHKFVLAARSDHWCSRDLNEVNELELTDISRDVGLTLMKWVYTDKATFPKDESFLIQLVKAANKYKLKDLRHRCEKMLMSSVNVSNCIKFYQTAEDIGAKELQKYCAEIISSHWHDLKTEDFIHISAPLLYEMFKSKSSHPLHLAIRHHREDVLFLFLIEFNSQLAQKVNEIDPTTGELPLQIALAEKLESIAKTLVGNGCDVNKPDMEGDCLLHKAIMNGDEFAATFLIKNGANVNAANHTQHITPLHLAASYRHWSPSMGTSNSKAAQMTSAEGMARITALLLKNGANTDARDNEGRTPLHRAIEADNESVLNALLQKNSLNLELRDNQGRVPLWLALSYDNNFDPMDEDSLAANLVSHGACPDSINATTGDSLLHMAASSGREKAGLFLASRSTQLDYMNKAGETPLHLACRNGMVTLVTELLNSGANPNTQTTITEETQMKASERATARGRAKLEARKKAIELFKQKQKEKAMERAKEIEMKKTKKDIKTKNAAPKQVSMATAPTVAVKANPFEEDLGVSNPFDEDQRGFSFGSDEGNPFLADIKAAESASSGANPFYAETKDSETKQEEHEESFEEDGLTIREDDLPEPSEYDISKLIQEQRLYEDPFANVIITDCHGRTPLHVAVAHKHENVVNCFINFQDSLGRGGRLLVVPDFNLTDSEEQTALEFALWTGQYQVAERLLEAGADIDIQTSNGMTLLHKATERLDIGAALFLLDHGADINVRTKDNMSVLQLAIHCRLQPVVEALCSRQTDLNTCDENGNCPLWFALKSGQIDVASTLVAHGCDPDAWNMGPNGCTQSLLHRAISEGDEKAACFLIRSNCDLNSPRRPGPGGDGGVEAWDGLSPLHLACAAGLDNIVQCLVEHKANVNSKDSEGRAPIHIAINTNHPIVTRLLLSHPELDMTAKDRSGKTPFAVALNTRNHEAAAAILARELGAAEQFDSKGRNFLHSAILSNDVDTVLFLIGVSADVNSRIQDSTHRTPLHLAVTVGSEIIVRHLLLAGARVNDVDKHRQTALHMAAASKHASIISALLREGINHDAVDEKGNNALHVAVQYGHVECVRILLTESSINAEAINTSRGQNPLHVLAQYAKENAVAIFELFCQSMPEYPINSLDADGNTALFLAYVNGAARLCRELLRAGGSLATVNKHGVSIFNAEVPTKKLLYSLLDLLDAEPPWSDGTNCHECSVKFTVKTRKHHCRHCGRLLCSKCSDKQIPIVKYELPKPVRVCDVCFEMLTSGVR